MIHKVTALVCFKFHRISLFLLGMPLLLISCYKEHREKPIQPTSHPAARMEMTEATASISQKTDANENSSFSSLTIEFKVSFERAGNVRYKIHGFRGVEKPLYTSGLISISNDLSVSGQVRLFSDSIFKHLSMATSSTYADIILEFENENGSTIPYSAGSVGIYFGHISLETSALDNQFRMEFSQLTVKNGADENLNTRFQPFTSLSFLLNRTYKSLVTKAYISVTYLDDQGLEQPFAKSELFDLNAENATLTHTVDLLVDPNIQLSEERNAYTALRFYLVNSSNQFKMAQTSASYNLESKANDTRKFTFKDFSLKLRGDINLNGYGNSYTLKLTAESSDNSKKQIYIFVGRERHAFGDVGISYGPYSSDSPLEIPVYAYETIGHGIYDLFLKVEGYENSTVDKTTFPELGDVKIEKRSEDQNP